MKQQIFQNQRLTLGQKNKNDKEWYKRQANSLDLEDVDTIYNKRLRKLKVNYDLFNNKIDMREFNYVCNPLGNNNKVGEFPAKMVNRDIVSSKLKVVLGMESKRAFLWRIVATNPEATTRVEQEEFKRIRDYVINSIMMPIKENIELKYQEQLNNKELSREEKENIKAQIAEELKAQTPEEVNKYMLRDHKDPAEVMSHQLLEYLIEKCDIKRKFNDAFKHGLISARSVMYVGILNGEPEVWNINTARFNSDRSTDSQFIEDGEWATCKYKMLPSEIIKYFGDELTQDNIDDIYKYWNISYRDSQYLDSNSNVDLFKLSEREENMFEDDDTTITVLHCVWKSLRKIGFLTFIDENFEEQTITIDETYKVNKDFGDVKIEWEWIPEVYETWKIKVGKDIYIHMRPIQGQFKDLDNLYNCKLPYYGVIYDNMNSEETSLMDRLKDYQYYYNIIMYRLELVIASDKGKKVLMNINSIPKSAGIDVEKWQYFFESSSIMWHNPSEEGNEVNVDNTAGKVVDLSLASDIQKYIEISEYLRQQAGISVGITDAVQGEVGPYEAVRNTQQSITQSSHILEPYFTVHNYMKKNVLQALIETAKIAYSDSKVKKLNYVLDDMSRTLIDLDVELLDNSTLGLFVSNSAKIEEVIEQIKQLSHAALQNQKIELSDVISVIKQDGIVEIEETLKLAEQNRREQEQRQQQDALQAQSEENERIRERERERNIEEKEKIVLTEEERRKTEIIKGSITAAGFNPDQDKDNDGVNDFIEIAKHGLDAEIKQTEANLNKEKFEHQKSIEEKKLEQTNKKLELEDKK